MEDKQQFSVVCDGMGHWGKKIIECILEVAFPEYEIIWYLEESLKWDWYPEEVKYKNNLIWGDCSNPDIIIRAGYYNISPLKKHLKCPYIMFGPERGAPITPDYLQKYSPLCWLFNPDFVKAGLLDNIPNKFHVPYMLAVPFNYDNIREYSNTERKYTVAYIASNIAKYRDDMFIELNKLLPNCHAYNGPQKNTELKASGYWKDTPHVFKDYYFAMCMENNDTEGHMTEKMINAYRGGCIPIYWGSKGFVKEVFNPDSFVYIQDFKTYRECAEYVSSIYNDRDRLIKMLTAPIFKDNITHDLFRFRDKNVPEWMQIIANHIRDNYNKSEFNG